MAVLLIGSIAVAVEMPVVLSDERAAPQPPLKSANETGSATAPSDHSIAALKVTVPEMECTLVGGRTAQEFTMRLIIAVTVENATDKAITVAREQFQLLINGEPAEISSVDAHPTLPRTDLQPGKTVEGWVGFGSIVYDGKEPAMVLRLQVPTRQPVDISLNDEVRRQSAFQNLPLGPDGCLLQISTNRNLDVLSIWPVETILKSAASQKVGRILFSSTRETPPVIVDEFKVWLSSMIDASAAASDPNMRFLPRISPPLPRSDIRFQQIFVGGLNEATNRQYAFYRRSVIVLPSAEAAVASALTPVYRRVPAAVAVADLRNPNPGVRRAAMAGAVDRLTSEQAETILNEALHGSPELQAEMAGYLNLIPGSRSVETLRILSDSIHPQVSLIALRSLIRSLDPAAEKAMTDLWQASSNQPDLQRQILGVIIELNSERWTSLVAGYVAEQLRKSAVGSAAVDANPITPQDPPDGETEDPVSSPSRRSVPNHRNLMASALSFLHQQGHTGTLEALRSHLLQISDPGLQDIALTALVNVREPVDDMLIRQCLDQRIRSGSITDSIRTAVVQLPSPQWTELLLRDLKSGLDASNQPLSAQALLRCATAGQLDQIIDEFESLPPSAKQQTLRHLVLLDHPRWRTLAQKLIELPLQSTPEQNTSARSIARTLASETIQLLAVDASEEAIAMLNSRLATAVAEIGPATDIPIENRTYVDRLIETVALFAHPECRRSLNRVARCENQDLREKAVMQIRNSVGRSPAFAMLAQRQMMKTKEEQTLDDNDETITLLSECIEQDPYLPEMYIRRSSVLMHLNRFRETIDDLKIADRLSPENMDVVSMIALTEVRLGDTEAGLKHAEELVVTAPRDVSSLYNGACSYSRAIENPNVTDEQKQSYGDRAIALLRLTIATDFRAFEDLPKHLQADEDLVAIHTHPEWAAVVEETKKMDEENKKPQPE